MWPFKKKKKQQERKDGKWIIYNIGTDLEFGECDDCGHEIDSGEDSVMFFPDICPGCGRRMHLYIPEEELFISRAVK